MRTWALPALLAASLALAACDGRVAPAPTATSSGTHTAAGSSASPSTPPPKIDFAVEPARSRLDQDVRFLVSGLGAYDEVTLVVEADDGAGHLWRSETILRADGSGSIDTATTAPSIGGYVLADPSGPLTSLMPDDAIPPAARWRAAYRGRFAAMVRWNDIVLARETFTHQPYTPALGTLTKPRNGFVGYWVLPPRSGAAKVPAVLYIGGSEGGLPEPLVLSQLAARGVAVLGVAYFGAPGLPKDLASVPVEYFSTALTWLRAQPQVDRSKVTVLGVSRGAEAASLLATSRPRDVARLLLSVPAHVARCSYPDHRRAAWTVAGQPVACDPDLTWSTSVSSTDPAALPLERFPGPVLLLCGQRDAVLPTCPMSQAILKRRGNRPTQLLRDEHGGHGAGWILPNVPTVAIDDERFPFNGALAGANARARAMLWPKVLAFVTS